MQTTQEAWNDIGKQVDPKSTTKAMLTASGLNWSVKKTPLFYSDAEGNRKETGKFGVVREDNDEIMTVCSDVWKPVQNETIIDLFQQYMTKAKAKIERIGALDGGRTIWALADIGSSFSVQGKDEVKGYVLAHSSHKVGKATGIFLTPIRIWCANSIRLAINESFAGYKQNHLSEFNTDLAREAIGLAQEQMQSFGKEAEKLRKTRIADEQASRMFIEAFGVFSKDEKDEEKRERHIRKMLDDEREQPLAVRQLELAYRTAPGADPGNAWGVLNAVTYWADHVTGSKPESRLQRSWFGTNNNLKQDFKKKLLQLA